MTALLAKTFSIESTELWFQLRQVYMHEELLRPVFVWGVGLGTLLLLIALVLMQVRGTGFGAALGGQDYTFRTKRGLQRQLHRLTIVVVVVFVAISAWSVAAS